MGNLRKILIFLAPYKGLLILASVLTGGLTVIGMAPPLLMRRLVNDVAGRGNWGIFPLLIALLFAVPLLRALVNVANSIALNTVSLGVIAKTRKRMFDRLMRLSLRFHDEMPVGSISQRLMGDVANVSAVVTGGVIALLTDVIAVGFAAVVMVGLSWPLSLLVAVLLPLYYLNYRIFSKRIQRASALLRAQMDHISSTLQERLSAHELIQAYGQEKAEAAQFSSQAKQIMDAAVRGSTYNISYNQVSAFVNKLCNTTIYCAGCYAFVKGSMGYGDVIAFCAYATQLLGPVVRFSSVANQLNRVSVSVDRIAEILSREPDLAEAPESAPIGPLRGDIRLEGFSLAYDDARPVLEAVAVEVPAGAHVAVAGPAGAGRTTLAMLLQRFYEPVKDGVDVDGRPVREYRLRGRRGAAVCALPAVTVFDGTLRENLCYGRPDVPEDHMADVADAVGFGEFVAGLSDGYDSRVGTGGLRLPAGIQQQVGAARALLAEPLILIVDEAGAGLPPDSEVTVAGAVRNAREGRTDVLIVRRVLLARDVNRIVVLQDGRGGEAGGRDDLPALPDGVYRLLYARQPDAGPLPPPREGT